MKNTRALIVLALALVTGLVAMVLAASWLKERSSSGTQVVVAMRDVPLGTPLDATMLETVTWPTPLPPQGAFAESQKLKGRVVLTEMMRGEPILESKLAPEGTRGGLSAVIGPGRRAITVKVNEVMGVAGFALPGNLVDVMVNTTLETSGFQHEKPAVSKIVLERILVLAVAQEASRGDNTPKVVNAVTLEVTPEQAERLDLARSVGTLSLVLRNQIDQEPTKTTGAAKMDLFGGAAAPAAAIPSAPLPAAAAPVVKSAQVIQTRAPNPSPQLPRDHVEVIRGVARSTVDF